LAGTTRDRIEHAFDVQGLAMTLVDTAGLRESTDPIERIGMERTLAAVTRADLVLELVEADDPAPPAGRFESAAPRDYARECLGKHLPAQVPVLRVRNKIDRDGLVAGIDPGPRPGADAGQVRLSAQTGAGMAHLLERLRELAGLSAVEPEFIARERHLQALLGAGEHLNSADREARARLPALELLAEELRLAQAQLGSITGEFSADDLLGTIFGRFCIGK
jgi:tRNA modification GTPase